MEITGADRPFYNRDIYAHAALNQLIPKLSDHDLGMFYSQRVGGASQTRDPRLVALAQVETDFATAPGLSFEALASKSHCREIAITDINGSDLNVLRAFDADLLISIRFGQIFKGEAIAQPRTGIINPHSGLLPEYKGSWRAFGHSSTRSLVWAQHSTGLRIRKLIQARSSRPAPSP